MKFKSGYIIYIIAAALLVMLLISHYSTKKQYDQNTISQVAQNEISNLQSKIDTLKHQNSSYKTLQKILLQNNKDLERQISIESEKRSQIAGKYELLKAKIKELPEDSAAALFLDRADLSEVPVQKYDNNYLVPAEAINFYNVLAVDCDELKEVNQNLNGEISLRILQQKTLTELLENKDAQIANLNQIIDSHQKIIEQKNNQIKAEQKRFRLQKIKTIAIGSAGLAILIGTQLL